MSGVLFLKQNVIFLPKQFRQAFKAINALCIINLSRMFWGFGVFFPVVFGFFFFLNYVSLHICVFAYIYGKIVAWTSDFLPCLHGH